MMKSLLLFVLSITLYVAAFSQQLYPYQFSSSNQPYQELSGATELFQGSKWDDTVAYVPIGFSFKWAYDNYFTDSVFIDTYGMLHLKYDSIIIFGFPSSSASAYWADLCDLAFNDPNPNAAAKSSVSYLTTGTAGNQIFKVQFKNCGFYEDTTMLDSVNFQIWLYEGSHAIEFHYGRQDIQDIELDFGGIGPHVGLEYKTTIAMNGNTITNFTVDSFSTIVGSNIAFADSFSTNGFSLFNTIPNYYFMTNVPDSGQVFRYVPGFAEGTQNTILFKNTKVYPTLVEQTVHIQTDLKDYQVYVVNMFGDVVFSSPRKEPSTMDLSGLPSGFYLLKVVSNKQETVFKIQKK